MVLKLTPFVKLLIPFVSGIYLAILFNQAAYYAFIPLVLFTILFLIWAFRAKNIASNSLSVLFVSGIFLSLGAFLTYNANPHNHSENLRQAGPEGKYLIRVSEIPQCKAKTIKIQARVIAKIENSGILVKASEYALLYFDKKLKSPMLGDELIVKCRFVPIAEPENPYQFNYKRFLEWKGIYYQTFVKNPENIINTGFNSASLFERSMLKGSVFLRKLFKENLRDSTSSGVTEALIFGYKDDLPKDLVDSYSRTGTLHVLAVSGLHVAIVFLLLARFLWFMDNWPSGVWLKTFIVIIFIWLYCILTGMSPSVIRAGLMISFVLAGKVLNRQAGIYNIIAVSAFIILCFNPFWITNVGFQLSFAAVLGIITLQPYLIPLWTAPNWFFRQIWNILIISVCAQIATFPLSLYYFNQFPNYFLLSNLFIIPLTTAIIYCGIAMVVFSKIPLLLMVFSWLTGNLVSLTNRIIKSIEKFPFSFTDGIKLELSQLILLYICIGCIIFWLVYINKKGIIFALLSLTLIAGISCADRIKLQKEHGIAIFSIPGQNALIAFDGRRSILFSDSLNSSQTDFYIRGWLIDKRVWPLFKKFDLKTIKEKNVEFSEMQFKLKKGVLFFKGSELNLDSDNLEKSQFKRSYILPIYFKWKIKYRDNMTNTLYIGLSNSKRLQKKVEKFMSKYHNNVISVSQYMVLKY